MATNAVTVTITGDDRTSAAFASATAGARTFQSQAENAFGRVNYSIGEARHSAMLLGEEIGVRVPRALAGVLAQSQLLGPALAAAFSGVAFIGFIDLAAKVPDAIKKITDEITGLAAAEKELKSAEEISKAFEAAAAAHKTVTRDISTIGLSGSAALRAHLGFSTEDVDDLDRRLQTATADLTRLQQLSRQTFQVSSTDEFGRTVGTVDVSTDAAKDATGKIPDAQKRVDQLKIALDGARDSAAKTGAELTHSLGEEGQKAAEAARQALDHVRLEGALPLEKELFAVSGEFQRLLDLSAKFKMPGMTDALAALSAQIDKINAGLEDMRHGFVPGFGAAGALDPHALKNMGLPDLSPTINEPAIQQPWAASSGFGQALQQQQSLRDVLRQNVLQSKALEDGFASAFSGLAAGTKGVSAAFESMGQSILRVLMKVVYETYIESALISALKGFLGGGDAGFKDMSWPVSTPPGWFPGAGGYDIGGDIPGYAEGGNFSSGWAMVGERGPELVRFGTSGSVIPNDILKGMGGQNVAVQVNVNNQSSSPVDASVDRSHFDGQQYVVSVVLKDLASNGPIRRSLGM